MNSTGAIRTIRRILFAAPLLPLTLAVALACGGGDSNGDETASPTPTSEATPSATAVATPTSAATVTPAPTPDPTPTPEPQVEVTPIDPFEVRSAEAINVRDKPSTGGVLVTVVFPGETAKVLGEAHGEAVEAADDMWYQIEITRDGETVQGFLYAAYVVAI